MSAGSEQRPWLGAWPASATGAASSPHLAGPAGTVLGCGLSLCAPRHCAVPEPLQLPGLALTQGHTAPVPRHHPPTCHPRHEGVLVVWHQGRHTAGGSHMATAVPQPGALHGPGDASTDTHGPGSRRDMEFAASCQRRGKAGHGHGWRTRGGGG